MGFTDYSPKDQSLHVTDQQPVIPGCFQGLERRTSLLSQEINPALGSFKGIGSWVVSRTHPFALRGLSVTLTIGIMTGKISFQPL